VTLTSGGARSVEAAVPAATMTLEQLNIVLQLVGTLGVIASLIFVGLQVRQNTKATRVQVQENMTSGKTPYSPR
jgi:hypothetical protein